MVRDYRPHRDFPAFSLCDSDFSPIVTVPSAPTADLPAASARRFSWSPGLPTRRSALGALLITAAALGTFALATDGPPPAPPLWLAASRPLPQGHELTGDDLRAVPLDAPPELAQGLVAADGDLQGAVLLAPLAEGDLLARSAVLATDEGSPVAHELSLALPAELALGDDLRPGETVDLVATWGSGPEASTTVVARAARILRVETAEGGELVDPSSVQVSVSATTGEEAMRIAHAAQAGAITVVRSGARADDELPDAAIRGGDR